MEEEMISIPTRKLYLLIRTLKESNRLMKQMPDPNWVAHRDNKTTGRFANLILTGGLDNKLSTAVYNHKKLQSTFAIMQQEKKEEVENGKDK